MKKFSLCIGYIVCSMYNPYICQCAAEIGVDQTACHFGCLHCDTRTHKRCQINIATIFVFEWRSSAVECQATRVPENRRRWEIRKIRMNHRDLGTPKASASQCETERKLGPSIINSIKQICYF